MSTQKNPALATVKDFDLNRKSDPNPWGAKTYIATKGTGLDIYYGTAAPTIGSTYTFDSGDSLCKV